MTETQTANLPAAQVLDADEPVAVPTLYAVESYWGDVVGWVLERRSHEYGFGTPLLWYSEQAADAWIKESCEESGCYGGQRAVGFTLDIRRDPPVRCDCCGAWGHAEADCANEDHDHNCVNQAAAP